MTRARRTTLADLAEHLGLSANTVSRALAGKDGVSTRTRTLVLDEARRTGYILGADPAHARSDGPRTIAVTIPSATHQFCSELLGAIEAGARAASYSLDVFTTDESERQEASVAATIAAGGVAGAIVVPVRSVVRPWSALSAAGTPIVTVSRDLAGQPGDFVSADHEAGAYAAARHLLSQGCRAIVQFEEDLDISTISRRRAGFARAVAEVPEARSQVVAVPTRRFESSEPRWRASEAYRACLHFLDVAVDVSSTAPRELDAVMAGDDFFALGALRALTDRGLHVPRDVRLVGYGDHPYAEWLAPPLTSVRIPTPLIGEAAVSMLLQRIAGERSAPVRRLIAPELVVRDSSLAPVPGRG